MSRLSLAAATAALLTFSAPSVQAGDPLPAASAAAAAPKLYDETADAKEQIAAALAAAKLENKRVLIQWGGNWCSWCLRLHALYESDKAIAKELRYEYEVVFVDAGKNEKNNALGPVYGATFEKDGFPFLTILDADGKPLANQETAALEVKGANGESAGVKEGHDPAAVLKFLKEHEAPKLDANDVLGRAVAEAKASKRAVFLHFGAPWCTYCRKLDKWMRRPEISALLAKDFVDVKIDVDRMTGGNEVHAKFNPRSADSGIPWFVLLDAEGKPLADSCMKGDANTGFPMAPEEVDHFASMLKKAAKNLSEAEVATLVDSLRQPDSK